MKAGRSAPKIRVLIATRGAGDIPVIAGGIIPDADVVRLKKAGTSEIFLPGALTRDIIRWIENRMEF
jgi:methylmalonyl-CoA mutase, C-terminal domain